MPHVVSVSSIDTGLASQYTPGSTGWYQTMRALHLYLQRDPSDLEAEILRLHPRTHPQIVRRSVGLLWRIAREMSTTLVHRPIRTVGRGSDLPRHVATEYRRLRVDARMRTAADHLTCLGQGTPWVLPDRRDRTTPRLVVIPPHRQAVELVDPLGDRVEDVAAWWIAIPVETWRSDVASVAWAQHQGTLVPHRTLEYAVARITATEAEWVRGPAGWAGTPVWATRRNPLGRIPATILRAQDPDGHWWAPAPVDLLQMARATSLDAITAGHVARMQGHGQAWIRREAGFRPDPDAPEKGAELAWGPDEVVPLDGPNDAIGYATATAQLAEMVQVSDGYVSAVVATMGLNPGTLLRKASATAAGRIIDLWDRDMERGRGVEQLQSAESDIYEILAEWHAVLRLDGHRDWPRGPLSVEYTMPRPDYDPQGRMQALMMAIGLGQTSRVRGRAEADGVDLDEARRRMERDAKDEAWATERMGPIAGGEPATRPATPEERGATPDAIGGQADGADADDPDPPDAP
jgi:hypothetical protein